MKPGLHDLAQSAATDGQIPAWSDADGLWVPTDPPSGGGLTDPTTTEGDLIVRGSSGLDRLGVGTDDQVLKLVSGVPAWADESGGGGAGGSLALDNFLPSDLQSANLSGTYGDDFAGTSLDAKWTRRTVTSGNESWQRYAGAEGVRWGGPPAAGWFYTQPAPAGDFTLSAVFAVNSTATTTLFGPCVLGSTGAGIGGFVRNAFGYYMASLSAYGFSAYGNAVTDTSVAHGMRIYIVRLKKVSTNYSITGSLVGVPFAYEPLPSFSSTTSNATTLDRIGIGCIFTDAGLGSVTLLRFNLV